MKYLLVFFILTLSQSCTWFESDYDKLMNPIKKIKNSEKIAGKANPVFDGVVEPNFPDEKENDKTLEGVDSNHDGVRDDVEIWINRTAEDEYVRWAVKESYRKFIVSIISVELGMSEEEIRLSEVAYSDSSYCLSVMLLPYKASYIKKHNVTPEQFYDEMLQMIFENTTKRSFVYNKWNSYQTKGAIDGNSPIYCKKSKYGSHYIELINNARAKKY